MRSVTYEFDELPLVTLSGRVVARVSGTAEILIHDDAVEDVEVVITDEDGNTESVSERDPLFPLMRREIVTRWERCDFDGDRHYRPENDEHRLSLRQVV